MDSRLSVSLLCLFFSIKSKYRGSIHPAASVSGNVCKLLNVIPSFIFGKSVLMQVDFFFRGYKRALPGKAIAWPIMEYFYQACLEWKNSHLGDLATAHEELSEDARDIHGILRRPATEMGWHFICFCQLFLRKLLLSNDLVIFVQLIKVIRKFWLYKPFRVTLGSWAN